MNIGKMRNLVKVLSRVTDRNSLNEELTKDLLIGEAWAEFRTLSGDEMVFADQNVHVASVMFRMRFFQGMEEKCLIIMDNRHFEVTDVDDVEGRHVEHVVRCKELK